MNGSSDHHCDCSRKAHFAFWMTVYIFTDIYTEETNVEIHCNWVTFELNLHETKNILKLDFTTGMYMPCNIWTECLSETPVRQLYSYVLK